MSQTIFESPAQRRAREERQNRQRERDAPRLAELSNLKALYANLKKREAELSAIFDSLSLKSSIPDLIPLDLELNMIRRVLATAPAEVAASCRPPVQPGDTSMRALRHDRIKGWEREIARIEQHEIPGLENKLKVTPTRRELGKYPGDPDPHRRHYDFIREQIAAKRGRIEQCRALIVGVQGEIERSEK